MAEPKKLYKFVFVYNPSRNEVIELYIFNGRSLGLDGRIKILSEKLNAREEIILGKTMVGNYYQLYLEKYRGGSQYVREDIASISKFMDPNKIGVAISKYLNKNNLWKKLKD